MKTPHRLRPRNSPFRAVPSFPPGVRPKSWKITWFPGLTLGQGQLELHEIWAPNGWLFDIGDEILPNYMGIIIIQYKGPYNQYIGMS